MRSISIPDLLIGTYYRPASFARRGQGGIINFAEKREDSVWVGDEHEVFVIRFRPDGSLNDKWASVAVKTANY